jgi:hypothetical protein
MITRVLGIGCLALVGLGCGHVESHAVAFDRGPRTPGDVAVFAASAPASGEVLGDVVVHGSGGEGVGKLYGDLVQKARERGGNAVFIESMGGQIKDSPGVYSGLSSAHACGASCMMGVEGLKDTDETLTVELRGKVMRLSPEELARPAKDRGAP